MTLAMIDGKPVVVCWQARDFEAALSAAVDMGLPVATTCSVAEEAGLDPVPGSGRKMIV